MKKILTAISIFLSSNLLFGQWINLGLQGTNIQMTENNIGYKYKNTSGSSPAQGITYSIKLTQNDWQNEVVLNTGGGTGYGCCSIGSLYFLNNSKGLLAHNYQGIYSFQKTDDGYNWSPFASNIINTDFRKIQLVNDSIGYASGNSYGGNHGQLFKLTQSVSTQLFDWDTLSFNNCNIEFISSSTGFIALNGINQYSYLFKTSDFGSNWNSVFIDSVNEITSISIPDSIIGYISTTNGKIYKTINGGSNWTTLISPTLNRINSIDFINDSIGFIACNLGEIYKTLDGGSSWINENSGTISNIINIQIVDVNTAYCIDVNGVLFKNNNVNSVESSSGDLIFPIIVYPNPANNSLFIESNEKYMTVSCMNYLGQFFDMKLENNSINISELTAGIYFLNLVTKDGETATKKFIKK
jgi:photosystem II stability/assembly factor-like uncharacterized protein